MKVRRNLQQKKGFSVKTEERWLFVLLHLHISLNELYNNLIPLNEFLNKNPLSHLSLIPVVASSCLLPVIRASVDKGLKLEMKKDIMLVAMLATKIIWVYNNVLLRKELGGANNEDHHTMQYFFQ